MSKLGYIVLGWLGLLFITPGCAGRAPSQPAPTSAAYQVGSDDVEIVEQAPPAGAALVGPLEAVDGHGCGLFGENGTRAGAIRALRAQAIARGANFVHILKSSEPHMTRSCFTHEFRMQALAYRVAGRAPAERP